jgi:hypothetical protein
MVHKLSRSLSLGTELFPAGVSLKRLDAHKLVILNNRETTAP